MARASAETKCSICNDETNTFICRGCSKDFCFDHLTQHRQFLNEQLGLIQNDYNQFRQNIIDVKQNSQKHSLIKQIDRWECDSIEKIKQKANQCRQLVIDNTNESIEEIEMKLNKTTQPLNPNKKQKTDLNEIDLDKLRKRLEELKEELNRRNDLSIEQISNSFLSQISVRLISKKIQNLIPILNSNQTWKQLATNIAGGHGGGNELNQLYFPYGMFIDDDQTIVIADRGNNHIVEWRKNSNNSQILAGGNGLGDRNDQLNGPTSVVVDQQNDSLIICDSGNRRVMGWPRRNGRSGEILISNIDCWDLIMDKDGYLYISDPEEHEIRRWKIGENNGTIVAGGNEKGNRLDQLNFPANIFIGEDHSVYVSDKNNHRVMKWMKGAKEGIVVAGCQGEGNGLRQLSYPRGMIVDQLGTLYVADWGNNRVMRWLKGAENGTVVVGGNGRGQQPNQFNQPMDLSVDREKNLYVVDCWNNRVARFDVT